MKQKSESAQSPDGLARYMKLEALWILTNLAFGDDECIKLLINGTVEEDNELVMNSNQNDLAQSVASREEFFAILKQIFENESHDIVMIDQLLFSLGNISGTDFDIRMLIKKYLDLPMIILKIMLRV